MASITPFGQAGPWSKYKSSDLIAMAASGYMQITGEPDEPPLRQGNSQSVYPGAQYASVAILAALYYRDLKGGEGIWNAGFSGSDGPTKPITPPWTHQRLFL